MIVGSYGIVHVFAKTLIEHTPKSHLHNINHGRGYIKDWGEIFQNSYQSAQHKYHSRKETCCKNSVYTFLFHHYRSAILSRSGKEGIAEYKNSWIVYIILRIILLFSQAYRKFRVTFQDRSYLRLLKLILCMCMSEKSQQIIYIQPF